MSNPIEDDLQDIVRTGNGTDRDLLATTNDRLKKMVIELRRMLRATDDVMMTVESAVDDLAATFIKLDKKNGSLQNRIWWLTLVGISLSALQLIQVIDIILKWAQ